MNDFPGEYPKDFNVDDILASPKDSAAIEKDISDQLGKVAPTTQAFQDPEEASMFIRGVGFGFLGRLAEMGVDDAYILMRRLDDRNNNGDFSTISLDEVSTALDSERHMLIKDDEPDLEELERLKKLSDLAGAVAHIAAAHTVTALSDDSLSPDFKAGLIDDAEEKTDLAQVDPDTKDALRVFVEELRNGPDPTP